MTRPGSLLLASLLVALPSACVVDSGAPTPLNGGADAGTSDDDPGTCEGPLGPPITDFSGMDACCAGQGGDAHCLDAALVPDEVTPFLDTCADGSACVPDQFLETGGSVPPEDCTAFGGAGVCLSVCVPQVAENAALLQQDVCSGDQLCVPCISPLDDMPTGACELKEQMVCVNGDGGGGGDGDSTPACDDPATCNYEASCPPVIDSSTLTPCADGAHCLDEALVSGADPAVVDRLAPCANPSELCVPDVFIETGGKFTPATCTSVNDAEGRCLSLALPEVADQADLLPQATCQASEKCVPCYDPISGDPTGACTLSCDPGPTQPAKPFADCCEARAKCVPTGAVPADQKENLSEDSCDEVEPDAYLCVPNQILADGPYPACEASALFIGDYTGVCLSDCLDFGIQGIVLAQGDCSDDQKCAPCVDPLSGEPTGAPGCPNTP